MSRHKTEAIRHPHMSHLVNHSHFTTLKSKSYMQLAMIIIYSKKTHNFLY